MTGTGMGTTQVAELQEGVQAGREDLERIGRNYAQLMDTEAELTKFAADAPTTKALGEAIDTLLRMQARIRVINRNK